VTALNKPTLSQTPLWPHQTSAVETIRKYLKAYRSGKTVGACLVHMPTGTGKTGVIACASHFLKTDGLVLLLTPRVALREQLSREVRGLFFSKLKLDGSRVPKRVLELENASKYPSPATIDYSKSIVSMTIQMLYSMMNRGEPNHTDLQSNTGLVIVDEGHYEPSNSWREAIRAINCPRVIFTATPFRNDLKLFDIDFDHAYSYTLHEAITDKTVRAIDIQIKPPQSNPSGFVDDVIAFYDSVFPNAGPADPPRTIIRCESSQTIKEIGNVLAARGRTHVLIHETFKDDPSNPQERRSVPDPANEPAVFWVHQYKLLEGIDDPRFQLLACFEELRTTRALVQQVGRVIRNPTRKSGAKAYFLDHSNGRQKELWDGFLEFDKLIKSTGVKIADFGKKMLEALSLAQPDVVYLAGRFRTALKLQSIDAVDELILPCTANILRKNSGFTMAKLLKDIDLAYSQQDRDFRVQTVGSDTSIYLYLTFSNSPLLRSKAFIECKFGVTVLRECGDFLCAFDSGGTVPGAVFDHATPVGAAHLRKLFSASGHARLTSVSLLNSNLGQRAVRSRSITAADVANIVPSFDDHSFLCRTVQGHCESNGNFVRRYVGFQHGKVTDSSERRGPLSAYLTWLDGITDVLKSTKKPSLDFSRFAADKVVPNDPTPQSILLDVTEVQEVFVTNEGEAEAGEPMQISDTCCDVTNGAFKLVANGKDCEATVKFDSATKRYRIDSADLMGLYTTKDPSLKSGVVRFLNQDQSFRVIPKSEGCFYAMGAFYSPKLRFGPDYDDDQFGLLRAMDTSNSLATVASEKGLACIPNGSGWDPDSLFNVIDQLGKGFQLDHLFGTPDLVVCDDMGTEAADFIIADSTKKKVVFIHAKGLSKGHRLYAASPLQEVCGQATKNLKYLARFGTEVPPNAEKWHTSEWKAPKVQGTISRRIRKKPASVTTGLEAWKHIHAIVRNPFAEIEVCLFLGRLLKKSKFEKQLSANHPATEAKQSAYLLFSTMTSVASVGAKLRIVCSP
jgi:hypothetical protein